LGNSRPGDLLVSFEEELLLKVLNNFAFVENVEETTGSNKINFNNTGEYVYKNVKVLDKRFKIWGCDCSKGVGCDLPDCETLS
jgi:hypothetical protein